MPSAEHAPDLGHGAVSTWLRERLADSLQLDPQRIQPTAPLSSYGLDSMLSAMMLTEIEDTFGVLVDPAELPPGLSLDDLTRVVDDRRRRTRPAGVDDDPSTSPSSPTGTGH